MKGTENYVKIYKNSRRTLMLLKDEGSVSFVQEDYCYAGFDNFIQFCDQNGIETMTLFWD